MGERVTNRKLRWVHPRWRRDFEIRLERYPYVIPKMVKSNRPSPGPEMDRRYGNNMSTGATTLGHRVWAFETKEGLEAFMKDWCQ